MDLLPCKHNTISAIQSLMNFAHKGSNFSIIVSIVHLHNSYYIGLVFLVNNYKKKKFLPPSNREEYERKQIIKSELARTRDNNERIGSFFTKLDLPLPSEVIKVGDYQNTYFSYLLLIKQRTTLCL